MNDRPAGAHPGNGHTATYTAMHTPDISTLGMCLSDFFRLNVME